MKHAKILKLTLLCLAAVGLVALFAVALPEVLRWRTNSAKFEWRCKHLRTGLEIDVRDLLIPNRSVDASTRFGGVLIGHSYEEIEMCLDDPDLPQEFHKCEMDDACKAALARKIVDRLPSF